MITGCWTCSCGVVAVGPVTGSTASAARISETWARTWPPPRAWLTWSPRSRDCSRYHQPDAKDVSKHENTFERLKDLNHLSAASRVLARPESNRQWWRLHWGVQRRPGYLESKRRWGGLGGEKAQTAAEHPATPEGGQGEEPRLGEPPGSRSRGAGLQEGECGGAGEEEVTSPRGFCVALWRLEINLKPCL